jgi:glycosyltransferase involved in cell wall biosynthesis
MASISDAVPHIINLGPLKREEVFERLKDSNGLIFPSRAETFGLPLLEAMATRTPILASELDFSRDVCTPDQTFDPCSRLSIARAVERHVGLIQNFPKYLSASEISEEIK